ncbi:MAG: SBBP repeat-containing protein, partial [Candidatus Cloacimonadaceae bacterium]|nr:SBBP repeat-containing protein [Candidatus Cloacimonadaceae bacterium]
MRQLKFVLLIATALCLFTGLSAQTSWLWASHAGSGNDDYGMGIVTDDLGFTYQTGYFNGTATFGSNSITSSGGTDIFVAKAAPDGTWIWAVRAGSSNNDYGRDIAFDSAGAIYVSGDFIGTASFGSYNLSSSSSAGDIFVAKLDPTFGTWLGAYRAGGTGTSSAYGHSIVLDSQNNVYLAGYFYGNISFGSTSFTAIGSSGNPDIYIAKLGSNGIWQWALQAGSNGPDYGYDIARDSSDNLYVTGGFSGYVWFGGTLVNSAGTYDAFVSKIDANGNWIWTRRGGQSGWAFGRTIDVTGTYIGIGGDFASTAIFGSWTLTSAGNSDIFVASLTTDGNWVWAIRGGGIAYDYLFALTFGEEGMMHVCGEFSGSTTIGTSNFSSRGYYDVFTARVHLSGTWMNAARAGGSGDEQARGIAVDKYSNIYVSGNFQGTCGFDPININSYGNRDVFLAKYKSYAPPNAAINLFPANGATGMPRSTTISWRYAHSSGSLPTNFDIYINGSYLTQVAYSGEKVYSYCLSSMPYGYTANWKIVPMSNTIACTNPVQWTYSVMSQPADEDIPILPTQAVYSQITDYSGSGAIGLTLPAINIGFGNSQPQFIFQAAGPLSNYTLGATMMDKSFNPMPNPTACQVSFTLGLPQGNQTQVWLYYMGNLVPTELVHWNGSQWDNITSVAGASFSQNSGNIIVVFSFTSTGRGNEEFALNQGGESTLPVELSSFSAVQSSVNTARINWTTASETNLLGYNLFRNTQTEVSGSLKLNSVVILAANTSTTQHYS